MLLPTPFPSEWPFLLPRARILFRPRLQLGTMLMSVACVTSGDLRNHARRNQGAILSQSHPLLAFPLTGHYSKRAGPALGRDGPHPSPQAKLPFTCWILGSFSPWAVGFSWSPSSGCCHTRLAAPAPALASIVATATYSQLTITHQQLQLPSVRLCTACVLHPGMLHSFSHPHTSLPSLADLVRYLGILKGWN